MEDLSRLDDRVRKLQAHFGQATKDIDDILVSSNKVTKRGQKIEALEFGAALPEAKREAPRGLACRERERVGRNQERAVAAAGGGRRRLN